MHKIVMAASSKFFCSQLCRSNILVPVILKLEDFGLDLNFQAVQVSHKKYSFQTKVNFGLVQFVELTRPLVF